jgi:hypothetical protein
VLGVLSERLVAPKPLVVQTPSDASSPLMFETIFTGAGESSAER